MAQQTVENEQTDPAAGVRTFITRWSEAWSPGNDAEAFDYDELVAPFYAEDILAFDLTESRTVVRGKDDHRSMWEPFVRGFDRWRFTVLPESVNVEVVGDRAFVTLFVDNEGYREDGSRMFAPAQGTLFLSKKAGRWLIEHEHISLPRVTEEASPDQVMR